MKIHCPNCTQEYTVPEDAALDMQWDCTKCGHKFAISNGLSTATAASEPTEPAAQKSAETSGNAASETLPNDTVRPNADEEDFSIKEFVTDGMAGFKKVCLRDLFPIRDIFRLENLDTTLVRFFLFFGLFPLACMYTFDKLWQSDAAFFLQLVFYFSMLWIFIVANQLQVKKRLFMQGVGYMLFTATIGIFLTYFLYNLPIAKELSPHAGGHFSWSNLLYFCLVVGPIEEFVKLFPLLVFGIWKKKIIDCRAGVFLACMSGLGFAYTEGYGYIYTEAQSPIETIVGIFLRSLCLSLLHASWCGLVGYNLGTAVKRGVSPLWPTIFSAWVFSAVLHGMYDTFASGIVGIVVAAISILAFACFINKAKQDIPSPSRENFIAN